DPGLVLELSDLHAGFEGGGDERVLGRVEAALSDAERAEAVVPVRAKSFGFDRGTGRRREHGLVRHHVEWLHVAQEADRFREQLDPALGTRGLRGAVLVEMPRTLDVGSAPAQIDVASVVCGGGKRRTRGRGKV